MRKEDLSLLKEMMNSFNDSADRLAAHYLELEKRVQQLKNELAKENAEKERLRGYLYAILNSIDLGIVASDHCGEIIFLNRTAESMLGVDSSVVGRECGSIFGQDCLLLETIARGEPISKEEEIVHSDGAHVSVVEVSAFPVRNDRGECIGAVEVIKDISNRKRLEERIRRSETLSALGEMAIQIAHEIRNPLGAVQLYMGILERELTGDNRRLAQNIASGLRSIEVITSNLLSLARPIQPSFRRTDLSRLINEVIDFTIYAIEENDIELQMDYPKEGLFCMADPEQMKQVAFNLILNAIQAMPEGGVLRLSGSKQDNYVQLKFEDTGCGIDESHIDKIFNPFFSTRKNGTGLGLYTVDKIIRAHDATIRVKSQVGVGTSFIIELPGVD